jgi:hypothetical protein
MLVKLLAISLSTLWVPQMMVLTFCDVEVGGSTMTLSYRCILVVGQTLFGAMRAM